MLYPSQTEAVWSEKFIWHFYTWPAMGIELQTFRSLGHCPITGPLRKEGWERSLMAEWFRRAPQGHEMFCHDPEVIVWSPVLTNLGHVVLLFKLDLTKLNSYSAAFLNIHLEMEWVGSLTVFKTVKTVGEVVPARTLPTLHPPCLPIVLQLSC